MLITNHLPQVRFIWAAAGAVPAVISDLGRRRIPNAICALLFAGGILFATLERGLSGLGLSLLGAAAGLAVFLIFFLSGGMGGGDLKLMAAYGALLGSGGVAQAAFIIAAAGAILALVVSGVAKCRGGPRPETIPYAPAITFGALAVLLGHTLGGW